MSKLNKTTKSYSTKNNLGASRQHGFFSVGLGLGLLMLYGAIGSSIVAVSERGNNEKNTESQVELQIESTSEEEFILSENKSKS